VRPPPALLPPLLEATARSPAMIRIVISLLRLLGLVPDPGIPARTAAVLSTLPAPAGVIPLLRLPGLVPDPGIPACTAAVVSTLPPPAGLGEAPPARALLKRTVTGLSAPADVPARKLENRLARAEPGCLAAREECGFDDPEDEGGDRAPPVTLAGLAPSTLDPLALSGPLAKKLFKRLDLRPPPEDLLDPLLGALVNSPLAALVAPPALADAVAAPPAGDSPPDVDPPSSSWSIISNTPIIPPPWPWGRIMRITRRPSSLVPMVTCPRAPLILEKLARICSTRAAFMGKPVMDC